MLPKSQPGPVAKELAQIYVARDIEPGLAGEVTPQLMRKDALSDHSYAELGITATTTA